MPRLAQFILALLLGVAALTWGASAVVRTTVRQWFGHDVDSRVRLALVGARQSLANAWNEDPANLRKLLRELTRDERVIGAAACDADFSLRAQTPGFPVEFSCAAIGARLRAAYPGSSTLQQWSTVASLPTGRVHIAVMPVWKDGSQIGFAILLHDLSYIDQREADVTRFVLAACGLLAVMAFALPMFVARWARYDWSRELRRLLRDGVQHSVEFQPILSDVRELVAGMANDQGDASGQWTAATLRQTLNHHLQGEKIVLLANREPYIHWHRQGGIEVQHPASGLVTALEPVMRACSGTWVAHGSGDADRETVDRCDRVRVPPGEESYYIRRVWLSEEEQQGYYYGFSNEGLWPLCHVAHARPIFRTEDWRQYQAVNQRFADAVCEEVDSHDPIVLVQDYHFALAPGMIRKRIPEATVISFWHIPWPNAERMGICPWRNEVLEGLLGSSILGFHTQLHCNNFLDSVDRYLETRIDREQNAVVMQGHRTLIRPYPIALEWPVRWAETAPGPEQCRALVWERLGLKPDALLGVGVDRLDYTKGVEERLLAVEMLLERHPEFRGRFTFAQLAAPSRTKIPRYEELNQTVEHLAGRINERFGRDGYIPIHLLRAHHEPPEVFVFFRAADLCYVSSLHDGMNLVAKEFVAARSDLRGVLVLSEFTGAARELTEALVVNPYDIEGSSEAMAAALRMSPGEQADRMRSMRSLLAQFNVYRWAGRMLVDAARLRNRERVAGRLTSNRSVEARA
ncbi:MAG: trehalose-6-phosphate synthase [Acidobacteriota bacterium]|nr:trehalose-6-phosphate synthase [Acidobacteriota bacterium]